jgi:prepilin-type N-terminal cleavage/methylation domain-containing protein
MAARGFSLIELVTVIVIVGALAVVVIPRLDTAGFDAFEFRQRVLSAARFAQKTAMASSCDVKLKADADADTVTLTYRTGGGDEDCGDPSNTFGDKLTNPRTGKEFELSPRSGSAAEITSDGTVEYNGFGRADDGITIGLDPGDNVVIEQETGYARPRP